ncbi:YlbL family protein [Natronoglycomyces albus]|uniref:endopeptidase La n=1 Tax=Natronoglycomyces albus TaxID=2811108 RepID=A0A895XL58_9ACTN|nr:S16 family serine protease [Natronoglycomyces albus]QSB06064.1 PDZ domain-containing protein [Natronoglycomyces albus]
MKRRGLTVLLGIVMVAVLSAVTLSMSVAYVALGPGPTSDLLGTAEDAEGNERPIITADVDHEGDGQIHLTTVRVRQSVNLGEALRYWWDDSYSVLPRELIYPPDQTPEEIEERQARQWSESQTNAETAALGYLGEPAQAQVMVDVAQLQAGDVIVSIDGTDIADAADFTDFAQSEQDSPTYSITVTRDGDQLVLDLDDLDDLDVVTTREDPYNIAIDTEALNIGGPSAGLMFTLAIIDRVSPQDITGGVNIAGTGEIDVLGNVGAIGGVQQKVVGAKAAGAEYFFAPTANCADAVAAAPEGLDIVGVDTLDDAMSALASIAANEPVSGC